MAKSRQPLRAQMERPFKLKRVFGESGRRSTRAYSTPDGNTPELICRLDLTDFQSRKRLPNKRQSDSLRADF